MAETGTADKLFLESVKSVIKENLADEQFGVSELALKLSMSRSNLLRKLKRVSGLSVSQFIRRERLEQARVLLEQEMMNVSEVSYSVGFSSPSYFIKCFRDQYGYSPGKTTIRKDDPDDNSLQSSPSVNRRMLRRTGYGLLVIIVLAALAVLVFSRGNDKIEKSIAVLPFQNDSNDTSNVYLINGIMESVLTNLQRIEDLRVISRTSVELYRGNPMAVSQIARELNVNYVVEGSGQKIGNEILLNVQLIDARSDNHLWAGQFRREVEDIFDVQLEIARRIAGEVEAFISPEEEAILSAQPTENLIAYDFYLKGRDLMAKMDRENSLKAIPFFEKAIEYDDKFALANAYLSINLSLLDMYQAEKTYLDQINIHAERALKLDPKLVESMIAKALYLMIIGNGEQAEEYLLKAYELSPNSIRVINILSDFYTNYSPDTRKYLEFALKGLKLERPVGDSGNVSISYLHISNAFIQSGFVDEAEFYINRSLDYNPVNLYAKYVKAYILYARDRDLLQTRDMLEEALENDTTRLDILQETAKICYFMRDYESAYYYYRKFLDLRSAQKMNIYNFEDAKIAFVLARNGLNEESETCFNRFKYSSENDHSVYRHINLSICSAFEGDTGNAIEELKIFSERSVPTYWILLFLDQDPVMDPLRDQKEYKEILERIEKNFWKEHDALRKRLKEDSLI